MKSRAAGRPAPPPPGWTALLAAAFVSSAPAASTLPSGWKDAVSAVRVHYQMDTVRLEKTGAGWMVLPSRIPAREEMVAGFFNLLDSLREERPAVSRAGAAELKQHGLSVEQEWGVELGFSAGKPGPVRLSLALDPQVGAIYWRKVPGSAIYAAPGSPWMLSANGDDWKSRRLLPDIRVLDVASIRVDWRDSSGAPQGYKLFKLARDSAVIVEPDTLPLTLRKASSVFVLADQFVVDAFPEPGDASPPSAHPEVRVRIRMDDGSEYDLGAAGGGGPYYRVKHPEYGRTVLVHRFRFDQFRRPLDDLTALPVFGPEPDDGSRPVEPYPGLGVLAPHTHGPDEDEHEEGGGP